jgi:serine/threonine protein kinase
LTHPQIVSIQKAGWWDGAPFLAMEYVPQGSLADKPSEPGVKSPYHGRGLPGIKAALRVVEQVAEIVAYLHRQGVVHGNLKPSNVLLAADGIPRIADFNLNGGLFLGPLPGDEDEPAAFCHLDPEVIADPSAEPRPFSDIYALGAILYELLTGRPPFLGTTARETLEQIRSQEPAPPSRFNSHVIPKLEALCLRCLRKNPWHRYQRVYNLVRRLQYLQENPDDRNLS